MKSKILFILLVTFFQGLIAQIEVPPVSTDASVSQTVGFTNVLIEYNRPSLKGRSLLGEIVREGDVWRTGANMCTRLTLNEEITIEETVVKAGKYSVYSIPGKEEWTLILNKKISWGTDYDESEDVVRIKVPTLKIPNKHEIFTFFFTDASEEKATLSFAWGNTQVDFRLSVDIHERILNKITEVMSDEKNASGGDFYNAAYYYNKKGLDKKKALEWITICDDEKMTGKYWVKGLRSEIEASNGQYKKALKSAKKALTLVDETKNNGFVTRMNNNIAKWEK